MAQKVNIVLIDDIDQSEASETVSFALDGRDYEIDLSDKNAAALRDALAPFIAHARKSATGRRKAAVRSVVGPSPAEIRAWARENGFEVPERGRVSAEVREAYFAAN